MKKIATLLIISLALCGCVTSSEHNLDSVLWMQTASEYHANCIQTYRTATAHLIDAVNDPEHTAALEQTEDVTGLQPAVVMDVDETVLNNTAYNAKMIADGIGYNPTTWDQWIALMKASAVPGAVEFINTAHKEGVVVIYVTNRACKRRQPNGHFCPQEAETIENLKRVGVKNVAPEHILLKNETENWTSEKKSRRALIAKYYRILLLIGDDLGDFLPDVKKNITPAQRHVLIQSHQEKWGEKWFILPNPMYGSWQTILEKPHERYLQTY